MKKKNPIKNGLRPIKKDERDFSLAGVFSKGEIPKEDFVITRLKIKDQGQSDLCTAFSSSSASESQEGVELSPEFVWAKIREKMGETESWGADLRVAAKVHCFVGAIEASEAPFTLYEKGREFISNWENWDKKLDLTASKHKKQSFFFVNGDFDEIIRAMWKHKQPVLSGAIWRASWTVVKNGLIPNEYEAEGFGHAFVFTGMKTINGIRHLIIHGSSGESYGDKGLWYMPEGVANKELTFGNIIFIDMPREKAEFWNRHQILSSFVNWFLRLFNYA